MNRYEQFVELVSSIDSKSITAHVGSYEIRVSKNEFGYKIAFRIAHTGHLVRFHTGLLDEQVADVMMNYEPRIENWQ